MDLSKAASSAMKSAHLIRYGVYGILIILIIMVAA